MDGAVEVALAGTMVKVCAVRHAVTPGAVEGSGGAGGSTVCQAVQDRCSTGRRTGGGRRRRGL